MTGRFQFSLGRLFGSVSLLCLSLFLWRLAFAGDHENWLFFMAFIVVLFAAVGVLIGRPVGCILSVVLGGAFFFLRMLLR
ncbi:MAG TPA: hypothetical protein VFW87_18360 [Pirellulales bacterium]|nr:hypothetical protein [Pirellulales bacterium]